MSKPERKQNAEAMQPEYNFREGMRGKYADRYSEGSTVVIVAPDLAEVFPTSDAVNEALRSLIEKRKEQQSSQ